MLTRTPYCIPSSLGVRWRLVSPAHVSCRCPARTISRSKLIRQHRAFWRRSGYSRAPSYNCGSQLLAHRVILQQCSASVAFGAKRILSPAHRAVLGSARSRGFCIAPRAFHGAACLARADRRASRSGAAWRARLPRPRRGSTSRRGARSGARKRLFSPRQAGLSRARIKGMNRADFQPWKSVKNSLYANSFGAITLACTGPYFRVKPSS